MARTGPSRTLLSREVGRVVTTIKDTTVRRSLCLKGAAALLLLTACGAPVHNSARGRVTTSAGVPTSSEPPRTMPPVPAAQPFRGCKEGIGIGAGLLPLASAETDLILGPVRLAGFDDARRPYSPRPGLPFPSTKVPLYVSGTTLPSVTLRLESPTGSVRLSYLSPTSPAVVTTAPDPFTGAWETFTVETAASCGYGSDSWVGYNGGFVAREPSCAELSVLAPDGSIIATTRVGFFGASC